MTPLNALDSFNGAAFPDRAITDGSRKNAAWIAQMAKAGVSEFNRARPRWMLWAHDPDIADNIRYANGEQDTQQYRRFSTGTDKILNANSLEVSNRDGYFEGTGAGTFVPRQSMGSGMNMTDPMGLDSIIKAQPLPVLPVKIQALKALITQRYETNITALGQKAKKEKASHEAEMRIWMDKDLAPKMQQEGMPVPAEFPDPMPQTESELQTYLSIWQVGAAADLELKIQIADVESDIEQLMDEVADDILIHGYGGLFDSYQEGKRTVTKRILPGTGLFMPSRFPDYRDAEMGGVLETVYLETILSESANNRRTSNGEGKEWTKADREKVKEMAAKSLPNNMNTDPETGTVENTGALQVVRWRFRTNDDYLSESFVDEKGVLQRQKVKPEQTKPSKEKGTLTRAVVNNLYECTLICGTSLAYGCQKVKTQGRDLHDPLKARLGFSLYSAGITAGRPTSIVRRVKGIVDEMERSWRGYMADMRTYVPEGYNIQMKALELMVDNMKFESQNPIMEAYTFFRQTGDTFADLVNEQQQQVGLAVQKNPSGIPESAERHLNHLLQQLNLLEAMTGANAVVSASTPQGEQGKGVNQIALQGAANIMAFARTGLKKVYENHAKNLAGRIWATDAVVPTVGAVPGPDGMLREVGQRKDFHEYMFHMRVELGPSDEEWQNLYAKAAAASAAGQITVADEMMVTWLRNLKTAQRYLAMAVRRKAREDQENAANLQKQNGDVQTQTAQAAAKAQQETDAAKHQQAMELAAFNRDTLWNNPTPRMQLEAQQAIAQGNQQAKRDVAQISEYGDAAQTDARHAHEMDHTTLAASLAPEPQPVAA